MTQFEKNLATTYPLLPWKQLEFEQQAHARRLIRAGYLKFEGTGATLRVVLVKPESTMHDTMDEHDDPRFPIGRKVAFANCGGTITYCEVVALPYGPQRHVELRGGRYNMSFMIPEDNLVCAD